MITTTTGEADRHSINDIIFESADAAAAALEHFPIIPEVTQSNTQKCMEEYPHFRRMGISREVSVFHLAQAYGLNAAYVAKICKEEPR